MYCPNCEFEIKQEVTECPICGGVLMQHPDESPGNQPSGREAEEVPLDLHISNLLLDAKHELDAMDSMPQPAAPNDTPEPSRLDLEALLSKDADETPPHFPDAPRRQEMPAMPTEQTGGQDIFALPDDSLFRETTGSPFSEAETSGQTFPFTSEAGAPEQPFILDDSLFIDETAPQTAPQDSAAFIDEASGQRLASALDSMGAPARRPDDGPGLILGRDTAEPATSGLDLIPEIRQQSDASIAGAFAPGGSEEPGFSLDAFAEEPLAGRPGSKIRLIALVLLGVAVIAGAYVLADYFLQQPEPSAQIAKPAPPAVRKKSKQPVQKPETVMPAPAVSAEQPAPASETGPTPKAAAPDTAPGESAVQKAEEKPATEPQPAPPVPERIRTEIAPEKTGQQKAAEPQKKAEPAAAPVQNTPAKPAAPDKKPAPKPGAFSVHVFSFKTQPAAQNEIERMNKRGLQAYLETVDLGAKGIWHRVKVGPYATRAEAEQARQDIKKKYPDIEPMIHTSR